MSILTSNGSIAGWFLTPQSVNSSNVYYILGAGNVRSSGRAFNEYNVVPVLSLNYELEIGSGDGASSTPYQFLID